MLFGLHPIYSIGGSAKEAREKWLREMFQSADINNDGLMDEEESISLIKTLSDGVRQGSTDRPVRIVLRFSTFCFYNRTDRYWSMNPWCKGQRD